MTDTNVIIAAKRGCSDTGITEELATKLYNRGREHKQVELYAIVRFTGDTTTEDVSGDSRSIALKIKEIEPVVDGKLNGELVEHVRGIQQALFRNRKIAETGNDEALPFGEEDGPAPKVKDLISQGKAEFLSDVDDDDQAEQEPGKDEPHTYVDTAHATCGYKDCGRAAGDELHAAQLAPV